jgi:CRISPR/Cas system CMR-associated protein Cmr1 (group 7 of RAMP superfamily)
MVAQIKPKINKEIEKALKVLKKRLNKDCNAKCADFDLNCYNCSMWMCFRHLENLKYNYD